MEGFKWKASCSKSDHESVVGRRAGPSFLCAQGGREPSPIRLKAGFFLLFFTGGKGKVTKLSPECHGVVR